MAFVDLDPRKIGQTIYGVPVVSSAGLHQFPQAFHVAAVAKGRGRDEIRGSLTEAGRVEIRDFVAVA